ncbi:MAG: histidinol-phosphate transaminase [Thermoleophilia bacterium]|nr:histidinol-phosphate transaminase [Thermoleophilia bacterium]
MDGATLARIADSFFRPTVGGLVPYEPGKPAEEVQRELGLERVVKLASNEGPAGPFPAALEALARGADELNRYPDGGMYRLRTALAERHGVAFGNVVPAAGADAVVMYLSLACLDPGDEIVCCRPTFPSYVIDAVKLGAVARQVPARGHRHDLEAMLGEVGPRTKVVYVCNPNNPTSTMVTRGELDAYFERVPEHVLTVLDEAYFEYVGDPDYPNGIEEYLKAGRRVLVLRTFSKIYGLAGLRIGYGVGPAELVTAIRKVQNAFDVTQPAQDAALASLGDEEELSRRRAANATGRDVLERGLRALGLAVPERGVGNFVYADTGAADARPLFEALLAEGVIVRPLGGFGAPGAIRVSVGTDEENGIFLAALRRLLETA